MKTRYDSEAIATPESEPTLRVVKDGDDEPEETGPRFTLTTLGELGTNLPVGIAAGDSAPRVRPFRLRPFNMKLEKELAKVRERMKQNAKGNTGGSFVRTALAMMVQTIGPHNFDAMKVPERELVINQLSMPDVIYMYFYARHNALDSEPVLMNIGCSSCKTQYRWFGDLASMDVKVLDDKAAITRTYELRDPLTIRGKTCKILTLGLIKWDSFCQPAFANQDSLQSAAITASIHGIVGFDQALGTFQLLDTDLDEMTKVDMNRLSANIEEYTPGPQMDITPQCPVCKHEQRMMLDWSWDNFFSRSAQRSNKKT
jgi:hypothetical protein